MPLTASRDGWLAPLVDANPGLVARGWTLYALCADTVEFWQADHQRRHTRLLWP
jgi:pyridoxamine 5'-phosphate oxidase